MLNPTDGVCLFTDGSAWYKDRIGGWAYTAFDAFGYEMIAYGTEVDTTSNRMEMTAVIRGLVYLHQELGPTDILVYSDSEYVVLGASDPSRSRRRNLDLWGQIDDAIDVNKSVTFEHVKGHAGFHYNDLVDKLAGEARLSYNEGP
jgi:ribonuclease HI